MLPFGEKPESIAPYDWSADERKFVSGVYSEFQKMYALRAEPLDILGGVSLQDFWDICNLDYGVLLDELTDPNDPVERYSSTISRDKTDVFIANLISQLLYPDVLAQNSEQEIDKIVSRVSSSLLEWAYKNDGWPSESGQQKNARYVHKAAVEGTAFVLDVVTKDGLESELIPNEELYFQTYWQPDLQKHSAIIRAKLNILYDEAEQLFGHMDNWQYVTKGSWAANWFQECPALKDGFQGIEWDEKVQILYVWKRATHAELKELKKKGKVNQKATRACFYNVIINDIPMFAVDNLIPYKHGYFNISRLKMFEFSKPEFLYGQSVPWKVREDKRWLDNWKTLLRYKGKLGVLKPALVMGGTIDDEILLPAKYTTVDEEITIKPIEGISDGITQQDITLLQMAEGEIDRGTVSSQTAGQMSARKETARAAVIMASNADKLLDAVSQQLAFFQASRSFPNLLALFQYIPKRDLKKIAIPDQDLEDGVRGAFEVVFQDPGELDEMEELKKSFEIRAEELKSRRKGSPKEVAYVNPKYLEEIKLYVTSDAASILQDKSVMKIQAFDKILPIAMQNPDLADRKAAFREYLRMNDVTERILAKDTGGPSMGAPAQGKPQGMPQGMTSPADAMMSATAEQQTGQKMPALSDL